jgi:hypothetical protein
MNLTKGEYSQFTVKGKLKILNEFGILVVERYINEIKIKVYRLYDFHVEVRYAQEKVINVELVLFQNLVRHYC